MWGQGLRRGDTFAVLTARQLREDGFEVSLVQEDSLAHSGAVIGEMGSDGTPSTTPFLVKVHEISQMNS
jgi:hypothetical protein